MLSISTITGLIIGGALTVTSLGSPLVLTVEPVVNYTFKGISMPMEQQQQLKVQPVVNAKFEGIK